MNTMRPEVSLEIDEKIRNAKLSSSTGLGYEHLEALRMEMEKSVDGKMNGMRNEMEVGLAETERRAYARAKEYVDEEIGKARH